MLDEPENKVIMYHKGMQWTSLNIFWNTLFMHMKIKTKSKIAALSYELTCTCYSLKTGISPKTQIVGFIVLFWQ